MPIRMSSNSRIHFLQDRAARIAWRLLLVVSMALWAPGIAERNAVGQDFGGVGLAASATASTADDAGSNTLTESSQRLIRVGIYDNTSGTAKGPKSLSRFLTAESGFEVQRLTPQQIQSGALSDIDVLIMPGGSGSAQARNLGDDGTREVRQFVRDGGGYVGICAGSYLASSHYSWSLNLLNAKVVDREHWARGTGPAVLKMTETGKDALGEISDEVDVYYGQGPLLAPDTKEDLPPYETLALFASEIAKNGAPKGVMIGTTAIARAEYGNGRVICYSPHPEVSQGPNHLVLQGVLWAAGQPVTVEEFSHEANE